MPLHALPNSHNRSMLTFFFVFMASFSIASLACSRNDPPLAQEPIAPSEPSLTIQHSHPEAVTLETILKTPDAYNGRHLRVRCYYFEGFEYVVLCTNVIVNDTGYYQVVNGKVWAVWKTRRPKAEIRDTFRSVPGRTRPNYFHAVELTGTFLVRRGSGHLGEFDYQFEIETMQILKTD